MYTQYKIYRSADMEWKAPMSSVDLDKGAAPCPHRLALKVNAPIVILRSIKS